MNYFCYLIISDNLTYIGITNNIIKRLHQHNVGKGSKYTRQKKDWMYYITIGPFDKVFALKFEWYWKHKQNKANKWVHVKSSMHYKIKRLDELVAMYNIDQQCISYF